MKKYSHNKNDLLSIPNIAGAIFILFLMALVVVLILTDRHDFDCAPENRECIEASIRGLEKTW